MVSDEITKQNNDALESLDRFIQSYKLMLNNLELCEPKNMDGTKDMPPWLRDCRYDLISIEIIRKELEQAQKMCDALFEINHNVVFEDDENTVIDYHETLEMHQRIAKQALEDK